ncbi:hypothetical protein [Ekhidna sp.]|uniref:hypothetical protein n=1 Tax=Ekhidna sp. TaxID=2608089 RepID=UPI003B5A4A1C
MKSINWSDHILNFIAVILGVSLAFYINKSSEQKKEEREVKQIVISLMEELSDDRENYIEYQIPFQKNQSDIITDVINQLITGRLDSLNEKVELAINVNNYQPNDLTFKSITTSGKLDLIRDFKMRKQISNYYDALAVECAHRNEAQADFFMDKLIPWIVSNTSLIDNNSKALVNNREFINLLILYKGFVDNKLRHYEVLAKESQSLQFKLKEVIINGQ